MPHAQKIINFLKQSQKGSCDDCLEEALRINRHQAQMITSTLALTPEFTRVKTVCPQGCTEREKFVTSYVSTQKEPYGHCF